jgi:hypothetical protein
MTLEIDSGDVPTPLLERGDFVRLEHPYTPATLSGTAEPAAVALARERIDPTAEAFPFDAVEDATVPLLRDHTDGVFDYTHGTITEVISRYPARYHDAAGGPPQRVALVPFNPATGVMNVWSHPTGRGIPKPIDCHASDLVLVGKHDELRSPDRYDIPIADVYSEWGIEDLGIPEDE